MLLECYKVMETGAIICYVIEYTGKDSTVVKYEISSDYVGGMRQLAKAEL